MKKLCVLALGLLGFAAKPLPAQTAKDLNEGLIISQDVATSAFNLSWWGSSDKIYYLQHSSDLMEWSYLPFLEGGANAPLVWGLASNVDRHFFRLVVDDHPGGNPKQYDRDGDGIADWNELLNETDFWDFYNGHLPTLEIVEGGGQRGSPGQVLPLPLTVMVGDGFTPNAPVKFSVSAGAALVSANGVNGWATSLDLRSDNEWTSLARVYIKLPSQGDGESTLQAKVTTGGQTAQVTTWAGVQDAQLLPPTHLILMPMAADRIDLTWVPRHTDLPTTVEWSKDYGATWEVRTVVAPGVATLSVTGLEEYAYYKFRLRTGGELP